MVWMHVKGTAVTGVYAHTYVHVLWIVIVIVIISIQAGVSIVGCVYSLWGSKSDCCDVGGHRRMCVVVGCVDPLLITV